MLIFPTCIEAGYSRYACACGDFYIDEYVDAMGHNYEAIVAAPTQTKQGYTEHRCTFCDAHWQDSYTAALGLTQPVLRWERDTQTGGGILHWEAIHEADGYGVFFATSKKGTYTLLQQVKEPEIAVSVPAGKTYYFKVKAICQDNPSADSSDSEAVQITGVCAQPDVTVTADPATGKPAIRWNKVTGAKKYEIYRATSENGRYKKVKTTTSVSYTDSAAKVGSTYFYKVKAVASKSSYNSAQSRAQFCLTACARPVVKATVLADSGKPNLSWKAVTGAAGYEIWREEDGVFTKLTTLSKCKYTDDTAKADTVYRYKVIAVGAKTAPNSADAVVEIKTALAKPVVTFRVDSISGKPSLSWNPVEGAQVYKIYRSTKATKSYKEVEVTTGLEYTDLTANVAKGYYYKVIAVGANSSSAYSAYKKLSAKCAQPEIAVFTDPVSGKPAVRWEKISGGKKYEVYRATSENGRYKKVKTTTAASFTDTSAKVGTTYFYKIKAIASGSSYHSVYSQAQSGLVICAQPVVTGKTAAATGKPGLSWKAVSGAVGYEIYRAREDGLYRLVSTQSACSYTDLDTVVDGCYSYKVKAIAKDPALSSTDGTAVTVIAACAQPEVRAGYNGKKPMISWEPVAGAVRYEVYCSTKKSSGYKKLSVVESGESYTDTKAKKGKTYYYNVVAVSDNTAGAQSDYVKIKSK